MKERLFTKNFMLMFLANFLICVGFYMLMPVLPDYSANYLKLSDREVGAVVGMFALTAVLFRPFMGIITDRINRMIVYLIALIIFAICSGSYALASGFILLIITRMFHGFSWSGVSTANSAIITDIVPSGMRGQGMGYYGLSMSIAMALGPAVGVYLSSAISFQSTFVICMLMSICALFVSYFVKPPKIKYNKSKLSLSSIYEKRVFGIAIMEFFYGIASVAVMSFAVLKAKEAGITGIGFFFIVFAICMGIVRVFGGKVLDNNGQFIMICGGFVLYIIGALLLAFTINFFMFIMASIFVGFGAGMVMPTLMTMMMNVVPANRRGSASATVFSALDTGIGIGGFLMGFVADITSYCGMYIFASIVMLIPLSIFFFYENAHYEKLAAEIRKLNQ